MNALVNRGAPRDFLDVFSVIMAGLATVDDCWDWWQRKNPATELNLAKAQVLKHLASLELRNPAAQLAEEQRERTEQRRRWFRLVLLKGENRDTLLQTEGTVQ